VAVVREPSATFRVGLAGHGVGLDGELRASTAAAVPKLTRVRARASARRARSHYAFFFVAPEHSVHSV
jgi:hypothetical protein